MNYLTYLIGALAAIVTGVFALCGVTLTAFYNSLNSLQLEAIKNNYLLENEKIKNDYQREVEKLKNELAIEKDKQHFKFTKYHESQIEAIKKIYAGLVEVENAAFIADFPLYTRDVNDEMQERLTKLASTLSMTSETLRKNAIFLNPNTRVQIESILNLFAEYHSLSTDVLNSKKENHDINDRINFGKKRKEKSDEMHEKLPSLKDALENNLKEVLQGHTNI